MPLSELTEDEFAKVELWAVGKMGDVISDTTKLRMLWQYGNAPDDVLDDPALKIMVRDEADIIMAWVFEHWDAIASEAAKWIEKQERENGEAAEGDE